MMYMSNTKDFIHLLTYLHEWKDLGLTKVLFVFTWFDMHTAERGQQNHLLVLPHFNPTKSTQMFLLL